MNALPFYRVDPVPENIEDGVEVYRFYAGSRCDQIDILVLSGTTTGLMRNGQRLVEQDDGSMLPLSKKWYATKWQAHLKGIESYLAKKERLMDLIYEEMDLVKKMKEGEAK